MLQKEFLLAHGLHEIFFLRPFAARLAVFRVRIRTHMFLGDPDPLVRGMDPDPYIIMQK
jgi:hypothetical protein